MIKLALVALAISTVLVPTVATSQAPAPVSLGRQGVNGVMGQALPPESKAVTAQTLFLLGGDPQPITPFRRPAPRPSDRSGGVSLPLVGAIIGGTALGFLAWNECQEIGCTTPVSVPLAVGIGAGGGALLGFIVQRLRSNVATTDTVQQFAANERRAKR